MMDPNNLRDQLTKLHEELGLVSQVDPRSSQLLGELMRDIQRLTLEVPDAEAAPASASAPVVAPLPDRLERMAVLFEVDHPTLAASVRRLVDLLGKAGL